jgi:triose/dihydroxyacetone kinase / FAD-AMP lyase (cyclizing)
MKIVSGAAAKKYSFDRCVDIGRAVNAQTVSIGSSLDHCHVPGRQVHEGIPHDVCVVGAGIHNEPVSRRLLQDEHVLTYKAGCSTFIPIPIR